MAGNSFALVGSLAKATNWTHLSPSGVSRRKVALASVTRGRSTRGRLQQTPLGLDCSYVDGSRG